MKSSYCLLCLFAKNSRFSAMFLTSLVLTLGNHSVCAGNATWNLAPTNNDWNTAANWTPNTVPGEADVATFNTFNITEITFSQESGVLEMLFSPGANSFNFTVSHFQGFTFAIVGLRNNSGVRQDFVADVDVDGKPGFILFEQHSTTSSQTFFTARPAISAGGSNGSVNFLDFASAGRGTFVNEGAALSGASGGQTLFFFDSRGGEGTLISEGGQVAGGLGGLILFLNHSNAANATLVAEEGIDGGSGGLIQFLDLSTGDTARVEVFGNGTLDVSAHTAMSLGSIEGDGLVLLAADKLTVGSNDLSTIFSGIIKEGGASGGSIVKTGLGTLTLVGASTYAGGTKVTQGILSASNTSGSATGTGPVNIDVGTLGGSGIIAGAVVVGTGSGAGAFLAPGIGTNKQTTLTIQSALTFNSDATYTDTFKGDKNRVRTDLVTANGVTINGATITISSSGQDRIRRGTVLTGISNTSANPISGTFANLPDGAIVTVNGNNLQASYSGGDGNDLTLTVVP